MLVFVDLFEIYDIECKERWYFNIGLNVIDYFNLWIYMYWIIVLNESVFGDKFVVKLEMCELRNG